MAVNNIALYEFLKERENHLFQEKNELRAWTCIPLHRIEDFTRLLGPTYFDEGGIEVKLFDNYIAVDLNEIFETEEEYFWEYRACFEAEEVEKYRTQLLDEYTDSL